MNPHSSLFHMCLYVAIVCSNIHMLYSQTIMHSINTSGFEIQIDNYLITTSIGQIEYLSFNVESFQLSQGFQQPEIVHVNTSPKSLKDTCTLKVIPNPFEFNIQFMTFGVSPLFVEVFDNLGKKILSGEFIHSEQFQMLPSGVYFIRMRCSNSQITSQKIIKL